MHPAGRTEPIWIHPEWKKAELRTSDTDWMNLIDKNWEQRLHRHLNATKDDSVKTVPQCFLLWSVKIWPKENVTETGRVLTANRKVRSSTSDPRQVMEVQQPTKSSMLHLSWTRRDNSHLTSKHFIVHFNDYKTNTSRPDAHMLKKTPGEPLLSNIINSETELINSSVQRCYAGHRVTVLTTQLNYFSETLNMWKSRSGRTTAMNGKLWPVYFI